jgi:hypothetical protein
MSEKRMTVCSFTTNRRAAKQFCYFQSNPSALAPSKVKDFNLTPHNNTRVKIVNGIAKYTQKVSGLNIVFSKPTSLPVVKIADVLMRSHLCSHYRIPGLKHPQRISTRFLL